MAFSLTPFLKFIGSEYDLARAKPETAVGAYAHAYEFVFALISRDASGQPIFYTNAPGQLLDRKGKVVDLATWNISRETDSAAWTPAPGVDPAAWAFLQGVPSVNASKGFNSYIIREYTRNQYEIRFGEKPDEGDVQKTSNFIAKFILEDILDISVVPNAPDNPNHDAPTITDIGLFDAQAAAEALFGRTQIAGWAGNPLLILLGHSQPFQNNILERAGDTYDLLSVIKAMRDSGVLEFSASSLKELALDTWHVAGLSGAGPAIGAMILAIDQFILNTYGPIGQDPFLTIVNSIQLGRGTDVRDNIIATADAEYIHGGGGDDYIVGSLTEGYDKDVVDGGKGKDRLDFTHLAVDTEVRSTTQGYSQFSLEIDRASRGSLLSTTYAYYIEELTLGAGADDVRIKLDLHSSLQRLETGAGDDNVEIDLVKGHGLTELHTGTGNDRVEMRGDGTGFRPVIYLGAGDDILLGATPGAIVYGEAGKDIFHLASDYLIADATGEDRVSYNGMTLTGGIKWSTSESPWAKGRGGIRYGVNTDGELVIRDPLGNETYVANYNYSFGNDRTAGILIGEVTLQFTLLRNAPPGFLYDSFRTLFGPVLKALTGQSYFKGVDPLVLDLDGDGFELNARTAVSPLFDIDGDGFAERTGWVRGDDAFLVRDTNGNGRIDNLGEMFGTAGVSGFEALRPYDSNADGKITGADKDFAKLALWQDKNGNGITDAGELRSLAQAGIASIDLLPSVTTPKTVAGNEIVRSGSFAFADGKSGAIADIVFDINQRDTVWLGDRTVDAVAAALPELKGFGTLTNLRIATTDSATLKAALQAALPKMNTTNLEALRAAATPVLTAWTKAVPVPIPADVPGMKPHVDVAIRAGTTTGGGSQVYDFAYKVTDVSGSYWKLASGAPVLNGSGVAIPRPTYAQVLAQPSSQGAWTVFKGEQIQFLERYLGNPLPLGENNLAGTAAISAAGKLIDLMWDQLNQVAVRLAVQGPLKAFFPGIAYDSATDKFVATTARQLAPSFEAIFKAAPATAAGADAYLAGWKPLFDVFLQNYARGEEYQKVTLAYLFQNIVAAYENVGLATTIVKAAAAFDIPSPLLRTGAGTLAGGNDADIFYLSAGNQVAKGGLGPDTYVVGRNFGSDVIDDYEDPLKGMPDTLRFAQYSPDQLTVARDGMDLVITVKGTANSLRILGQFAGQRSAPGIGGIDPDRGVEEIVFANGVVWDRLDIAKAVSRFTAGNDIITGTDRIDFLEGGRGDDTLTGGGDGDLYIYGPGDGKDVIVDNVGYIFSDAPDLISFKAGIAADKVTFLRVGASNDLVIRLDAANQITVKGQFDATYTGVYGTHWMSRIEGFRFADGRTVSWEDVLRLVVQNAKTAGNDTIYGFSVSDVLDGGPGDDFLSGGNEDDIYIFGLGYGQDRIHENKSNILSGGTDTVRFSAGVKPGDVRVSRVADSNDVSFRLPDGSTLLIEGQLSLTVAIGVYEFHRIERFEFADGTVWSSATVKSMLLAGQITAGNDITFGYNVSNDTIAGSPGNDVLHGLSWDDTYQHKQGDGRDTIVEGSRGGVDTLQLTGAALIAANLTIQRSADRATATLVFKGVTDTITLAGQFSGWREEGVETIRFGNGAVWTHSQLKQHYLKQVTTSGADAIVAFDGSNDTIAGGLGNDTMTGLGGDDWYVHAQGDGRDTIVETGYGGNDTLQLTGAAFTVANLVLQRSSDRNSVTLLFKGVADAIILTNEFGGTNSDGVETIRFGDGRVWGQDQLRQLYLKQVSTPGADTIYGFSSSNDTITGGRGNDSMNGLSWDDTYVHALGDGADIIVETAFNGGADLLRFTGAGLTSDWAVLTRLGDTIVVRFAGLTDTVTLVGQLYGWRAGVESILFSDGVTWTGASLAVRYLSAAYPTSDAITGFDENDLISAGAGNDVVTGGKGDDRILGGDGNDWIAGGPGSDYVDGGTGIDTISFADSATWVSSDLGANNHWNGDARWDNVVNVENVLGSIHGDYLYGNAGDNKLSGGAGDDTLAGVAGRDTLEGAAGGDRLSGGDGNDLLIGGGGADYLDGGAGIDAISYAGSAEWVHVALAGNNHWNGDATGDNVLNVENIVGSDHDDRLSGNGGANAINGGRGNDIIAGGGSADGLTGGGGNDSFVYEAVSDSLPGAGADRITDFGLGDRLDLSAIDANTIVAGDQAFVRAAAFDRHAGQFTLAYDAVARTTTFLADVNGDGVADLAILFTGDVTGLAGSWVM